MRLFCKYSQLIKLGQSTDILLNQRFIKKSYAKYPKDRQSIGTSVEDLYFTFHCEQDKMTFDHKMAILESILDLRPNNKFKELSIVGIENVIKSLTKDLQSSNYSDDIEYNISQFINILHKIEYYDTYSWVSAVDNYHKQGLLNWVQYRQFTHSIYDFSFRLTEDWQQNIVNDISQEAWRDFVGFLENKFTLDLDEAEINETYQHLRKFRIKGDSTHVSIVLRYFLNHLKLGTILTTDTYHFLLTFSLDHAKHSELTEIIQTLFKNVVHRINEDNLMDELIHTYALYEQLLDVLINKEFYKVLREDVQLKLEQQLQLMFINKQLEGDTYTSIIHLCQIKALFSVNCEFIQSNTMLMNTVDDLCLQNLGLIKQRKQKLVGIINAYHMAHNKGQYLGYLAKANLTVEDVEFNSKELMQCLVNLDETDLVYYLTEFLESVLYYIGDNIDQFSTEDWCFSFYIIYKYVVKGCADPTKYDVPLSILKQYIKLNYMTNYRRALPANSSFYKILQVCDLETFLSEDLINYY